MVLHWPHRMPDLAILALVVVVVTALAMLAPQLSRRVLRLGENKEREDAAFDGYEAVASMVGVVLAFSLVQANGELRTLEGVVTKEASAISTADRVLLLIGRPELAELTPTLAACARSIIDDEWPRLALGKRSPATDKAFTAVSKPIRSVTPADPRQLAMYNELLRNLDDIVDLREETPAATDEGLPSFFWITVAGLLVVSGGLAALSGSGLSRAVGLAAPRRRSPCCSLSSSSSISHSTATPASSRRRSKRCWSSSRAEPDGPIQWPSKISRVAMAAVSSILRRMRWPEIGGSSLANSDSSH